MEDLLRASFDTPVYQTPLGVLPIAAEAALGDGALVQTKAVTPPTGGKLLYAMHARLLREAKARAIAVPRPGRREMLHA